MRETGRYEFNPVSFAGAIATVLDRDRHTSPQEQAVGILEVVREQSPFLFASCSDKERVRLERAIVDLERARRSVVARAGRDYGLD